MDPQEFLDAALAEADHSGRFDPLKLSKRLNVNRAALRGIGESLQKLHLIDRRAADWQLIGVAGELARALTGRNVDRAAPRRI